MSRTFSESIIRELLGSTGNAFLLNHDPVSLEERHLTVVDRLRHWVERLGARRNFFRFNPAIVLSVVDKLAPYLPDIEWLYAHLSDEWSRNILVRVIAYRMLGPTKVRMPLDREDFWQAVKHLKSVADYGQCVDAGFRAWQLPLLDLHSLNIPVVLHTVPAGAQVIFQEEQYAYRQEGIKLAAGEGDVVMDVGGCWGDTALYFARQVGKGGRVFSFEFLRHNLAILRRNLALNAELQERITVIEAPVWNRSGETLSFIAEGPGSRAAAEPLVEEAAVQAVTIAIDDFTRERKLSAVDFIKMDIEGAELEALRGAEATLRKFKPTLAIAVYHSLSDLVGIPKWIASLKLDYKLYLGHYGVNEAETILFCQPSGETP